MALFVVIGLVLVSKLVKRAVCFELIFRNTVPCLVGFFLTAEMDKFQQTFFAIVPYGDIVRF